MPGTPCGPRGPCAPTEPCGPCDPTVPCGPWAPIVPWGPWTPVLPCEPWTPAPPCAPWGPRAPCEPAEPCGPCGPWGPVTLPGAHWPSSPVRVWKQTTLVCCGAAVRYGIVTSPVTPLTRSRISDPVESRTAKPPPGRGSYLDVRCVSPGASERKGRRERDRQWPLLESVSFSSGHPRCATHRRCRIKSNSFRRCRRSNHPPLAASSAVRASNIASASVGIGGGAGPAPPNQRFALPPPPSFVRVGASHWPVAHTSVTPTCWIDCAPRRV